MYDKKMEGKNVLKKRMISLLSLTVALSLLASCGSANESSTTQSEEATQSATATEEEVSEEAATESAETTSAAEASQETTEETSAEPNGNVSIEQISIAGESYDIPAIVTIPSSEEKVPCVIMLHGTGTNKDEAGNAYIEMADVFAANGIASIRIDFAGSGDSTVDYSKYTFSSAKADAEAAAAYAKTLDAIDGEKLGIMGWSQGGSMALLTAAEDKDFKSVLTWAGSLDLSSLVTDEMIAEASENKQTQLQFDWREPLNLSKEWIDEMQSTNILDAVKEIDAPILAINGAKDDVVLPENAEKIAENASNPQSEVLIIEGADHTFNVFTDDTATLDELTTQTAHWFSDTLK